jgi:hypothetical protein
MKHVEKPEDVPLGLHYAILIYGSVDYDDGYGGTSTAQTVRHLVTEDRAEWEKKISDLEIANQNGSPYYREHYVALVVKSKAIIARTIKVNII